MTEEIDNKKLLQEYLIQVQKYFIEIKKVEKKLRELQQYKEIADKAINEDLYQIQQELNKEHNLASDKYELKLNKFLSKHRYDLVDFIKSANKNNEEDYETY